MNQSDHNREAVGPGDNGTDQADEATTAETPFVAKLVVPAPAATDPEQLDSDAETVRVGSPFRNDPAGTPTAGTHTGGSLTGDASRSGEMASGEAAYAEFGPFRYTAMGASSAAMVVLLFAAAGVYWFPAGGAVVAVLGTVLSILGLFSVRRFRYAAMAVLPLHIGLFFLSYVRSLA